MYLQGYQRTTIDEAPLLVAAGSAPRPRVETALLDFCQILAIQNWGDYFSSTESETFHVLDLGTGSGAFARLLAQRYPLCQGVLYDYLDASPHNLQEVRNRLPHPIIPNRALCCSINEFGSLHESAKYDLIWALHSLYSLEPSDLQMFFEAVFRHLKPQGRVLIAHPASDSFTYQMLMRERQRSKRTCSPQPLSVEHLERAAKAHPATLIRKDISYHHHILYNQERALSEYLSSCANMRRHYNEWLGDPETHYFLDQFRFESSYFFPHTVGFLEISSLD